MAFDPKIRRQPPAAPRPLSAPRPATAADTKKADAAAKGAGYALVSSFEQAEDRVSVKVALSVSTRTATGVNDESIGVNDESIGVNDESIGVNDESIGVNDESIGVNDESIGGLGLGPERDAEALRWRAFGDLFRENPSYLQPYRTPDPSIVGPPNLGKTESTLAGLPLTAAQRDRILQAALSDHDVGHRLDAIIAGTERMSPKTRATLLGLVAEDPKGTKARIIEKLTSSSAWKALTPAEQGQLAKVLQAGGEQGMRYLAALAEARPSALTSKDSSGSTLLENLSQMASQPLNAALYGRGLTRERLMQDALRDIVNPDRVDQGRAPTCTVTSMQFELVRDEPAEYARLVAGLTGPSGSATMVGGGELQLQTKYVKPAAGDERSTSEVIFQSAAMEFANGADDFAEASGRSARAEGSGDYRGLWPAQQTYLLQHLFGVEYSTRKLFDSRQASEALELLRPYDARGRNRPVILEVNMGRWNHAVTFEQVTGGRVHFRDPYGRQGSMPEDKFLKLVVAVHVPSSLDR
ncbi:MAG: hypothetical protein HYZ28_16040 [Myxococcales bacterium]|nr:hypothetical protein [Myxococcales bacterium]